MPPQPPVIVVPGITASDLADCYPLPPEGVWSSLLNKHYERFALHPDDPRYEAREPARVRPGAIFSLVYGDLVAALREELAAPVFPFGYDWRQDCRRSAADLAGCVTEVLARCRLLPAYRDEPEFGVDLVGHSMGGLVIAAYLRAGEGRAPVRRVASLGAPFGGAVDAVLKLVTGEGGLTGESPREREREAARTIPALYQLLPAYPGAVVAEDPALGDILDPLAWQPSLHHALARQVARCAARVAPEALLEGYLAGARELRGELAGLDLARALPEGEAGWLGLAGVGSPTQVAIANQRGADGQPRFRLLPDRDEWRRDPASPLTGDGTVPFPGASAPFLPREALVALCPEDFSRWELRDLLLAGAAGFHAFLPAVNLAQRLVIRHLKPSFGGETWGHRPPGVAEKDWRPPAWLERRS